MMGKEGGVGAGQPAVRRPSVLAVDADGRGVRAAHAQTTAALRDLRAPRLGKIREQILRAPVRVMSVRINQGVIGGTL
jgi:hypothetical protein